MADHHTLRTEHLRLAYDRHVVVGDLTVTIPAQRITVIVGANACGKSTLLRGLARLLRPAAGRVLLDDVDVRRMPARSVATRMAVLPQAPLAPEGISVVDLVARGRYPHQKWLRQWSAGDEDAVIDALCVTDTLSLADNPIDELSGGQRQRVWIAMTLAQQTPILLLDEPTTSLDVAHQLDVLDLLSDLNEREGRTIVAVLHDLNHACRYAHHLVAMRDGEIVAEGPPAEVVTPELVDVVFGLAAQVADDPVTGTPLVVPLGRQARARASGVARR